MARCRWWWDNMRQRRIQISGRLQHGEELKGLHDHGRIPAHMCRRLVVPTKPLWPRMSSTSATWAHVAPFAPASFAIWHILVALQLGMYRFFTDFSVCVNWLFWAADRFHIWPCHAGRKQYCSPVADCVQPLQGLLQSCSGNSNAEAFHTWEPTLGVACKISR